MNSALHNWAVEAEKNQCLRITGKKFLMELECVVSMLPGNAPARFHSVK